MKEVFILMGCSIDGQQDILGVFSSEEKAREAFGTIKRENYDSYMSMDTYGVDKLGENTDNECLYNSGQGL